MEPIKNSQQLAELCRRCSNHDFVTVDTEFVRVETYWPKLCLIQLANPDEAVIIDALANNLDLSPVFDLMRNDSVLKVFHSGRQDIEIFVNLANIIPKPVFDTQIAGMVCGFGPSISYEKLVLKVTESVIDKSSQFTDWAKRPLTNKQLKYAISDVTHLRDVYQFLNSELVKNNRIHWIEEEMDILTSEETYVYSPKKAWKRLKRKARNPTELALFQELAFWREIKAQESDKARRFVMEDELIYEIAFRRPTSLESLTRIRGVTKAFSRSKMATELVEIVKRVMKTPADQLPQLPPQSKSQKSVVDLVVLLKVLLKSVCEENDVAPKIIATATDLEKIAVGQVHNISALTGWRRELFGEKALKLKNGEIGLGFCNDRIVIVPCGNSAPD